MRISIKTDNAAFEDNWREETARLLRGLAARIENGQDPSRLLDYNGNAVGTVTYGRREN